MSEAIVYVWTMNVSSLLVIVWVNEFGFSSDRKDLETVKVPEQVTPKWTYR